MNSNIPSTDPGKISLNNEDAPRVAGRDTKRDPGHTLCGPIAIEEAKTGMTLEVLLKSTRTGTWGWTTGGGFPSELNKKLKLADGPEWILHWQLNPDRGIAKNQFGQTVRMRPLLGKTSMKLRSLLWMGCWI